MAELTYGAQTVQLVLYAGEQARAGAAGYGYLLAVAGLGGLLSATVNARLAASTKVSGHRRRAGQLFCATQLGYADDRARDRVVVTVGARRRRLRRREVVAETALARVVPSDVLGRVMGVFDALSVAAMVLGAVLAPVLIARDVAAHQLRRPRHCATVVVTLRVPGGAPRARRAEPEARGGARLAAGGHRAAPDHGRSPANRARTARLGVADLPAPAGVDVVVEGAPAHAFYAVVDGGVLVHQRRGGRPPRAG